MNELIDTSLDDWQPVMETPKKRKRESWNDRVKRIKKQLYEEMFPMIGDKIKIYNFREDSAEEGVIQKYIYGIVINLPEYTSENSCLEINYSLDMEYYENKDFPICTADMSGARIGMAIFNPIVLAWTDGEI